LNSKAPEEIKEREKEGGSYLGQEEKEEKKKKSD
jgi:hypothetical protein